jgi:hypothetical protein
MVVPIVDWKTKKNQINQSIKYLINNSVQLGIQCNVFSTQHQFQFKITSNHTSRRKVNPWVKAQIPSLEILGVLKFFQENNLVRCHTGTSFLTFLTVHGNQSFNLGGSLQTSRLIELSQLWGNEGGSPRPQQSPRGPGEPGQSSNPATCALL